MFVKTLRISVCALCLSILMLSVGGYSEAARTSVMQVDNLANRIEITLDHTRIDSELTDFPILIHLSSNSGISGTDLTAVFDELGDNSKKIALTAADGVTQLYVEVEKWDSDNQEATLWVNVPVVSNTEDTILKLFYDKNREDNTGFVGDPGSMPAEHVWDSNYKGVWHLGENGSGVTGEFLDSTRQHYNGTGGNGATNETPIRVASRIGDGQSFDGANDYIQVPDHDDFSQPTTGELTVSLWLSPAVYNFPSSGSSHYINYLGKVASGQSEWGFRMHDRDNTDRPQRIAWYLWSLAGGSGIGSYTQSPIAINEWVYIVGKADRTYTYAYRNGEFADRDQYSPTVVPQNGTAPLRIGSRDLETWWMGRLDEVRISSVARSDAWIKASYYSESDSLLRYTLPRVYLAFATPTQTLSAGSVSEVFTIQTRDAAGDPINVSSDALLNLTSTSIAGRFDTDPHGDFDGTISTVTIPGGGNSADFYYRDTIAGIPVITAESSGLTGVMQQEMILPGEIDHYSVSNIDSPQVKDIPFRVTIHAQDAYNNGLTTGSEPVNLSFNKPDPGASPASVNTENGTATIDNMTLTAPQTDQAITFTGADSGKSGFSNSFEVIEQVQYNLIVNITGNGSVNKDPDKTEYSPGESVHLTASPDPGWAFSRWSGDLSGTMNPVYIIMDNNKTVTATFTLIEYTLTTAVSPANSGSVARSPNGTTYHYGDNVQLTATPAAGYTFYNWSGAVTGTANPANITIHGNASVTANFTGSTPTTGNFGLNSGNNTSNQAANSLQGMRFRNTVGTGTLIKLELLVADSTPNGRVRMGVYADNNGRPGSLLLNAGEVIVTNGWVSISGLNLPVTSNRYYWLAFNLQSTNRIMYQSRQANNSHYYVNRTYGALPGSFPTQNIRRDSSQPVMRATVLVN
jgi:hypothetical protein